MASQVRTFDRRLLTRRCVACGYDGPLLRGGAVLRCPGCRCNLQERPARSYAEMEGLLGLPSLSDTGAAPTPVESRLERSLQRWLAFLFFTMVGLIAIVYLAALTFHL